MPISSAYRWRLVLRFSLGALLLASGIGKALDEAGYVAVLRHYELALPEALVWALALGVTAIEVVLGACILAGWKLRLAAQAAALLNFVYFVVLTASLARGLQLDNCGCFGVFWARPLRWFSPVEDLALVAASLALAWLAGRREARRA